MNKLWVYGCSFSEPYGLEEMPPITHELSKEYRILTAKYWGTHLADKLGFECITRSRSGKGWNYITCAIEQDVRMWSKGDIIIISPSFFSRVTIMEFINVTQEELLKYYKSLDEIDKFNQSRWANSILNYQHFGYNIFTWLVENAVYQIPNTIPPPNNESNWFNWMNVHHEYWTVPPGNDSMQSDWHFNPQGHVAVAEQMYKVISSALKNKGTI